jgi:hypothetical protein
MSNKNGLFTRLLCLLAILLALLCCVAPAVSAQQQAANVGAVEGASEILRSTETSYKRLNRGDPAYVGDTVTTKSGSKLWLKVHDNSDASLGESSALLLNDLARESPSTTYFHAHQAQGIIRFIKKLPHTTPPSSYTITTPTAVITVEPANERSDFVVQAHNPSQSSVTVIWGEVIVKNISEEIPTQRRVRSCQMVYIDEGKEPSQPFGVSSETLRKLIRLTTIPGTLPEDVPNCESGPPPERPWTCPCPWGFALDPADGTCKPCAFFAGAFYNPETCQCECLNISMYYDPISGIMVSDCPTQMPVIIPGIIPPNPSVLPYEGCPRCACCPWDIGCFTSSIGDGSCPDPRCGQCEPGQALPWAPGTDYPCPKCCECDLGGNPFDPCGINAPGFPITVPCGAGLFVGKCISRSDCEANGGFFIQSSDVPGWPCWICQIDPPVLFMAMMKHEPCGPCQKKTWRKGKLTCVSKHDRARCTIDGRCGECRDGKCRELPPCSEGFERNARCQCVKKPEPKCASNEECRKRTQGAKPCCKGGQCVSMQRCQDGRYRCECEPIPPKPPIPPPEPVPEPETIPLVECSSDHQCAHKYGDARPCCFRGRCVQPRRCPDGSVRCRCEPRPPHCSRCEEMHHGQCVPCSALGKTCNKHTGRCEISPGCRRCEEMHDGRCMPCQALGKVCNHHTGRCEHRAECKRCEELRFGKCTPCAALGKRCDERTGRCVHHPPEDPCLKCYKQGMDCVLGRCVPKKPAEDPCLKCYQRGMDCVHGQCVPKKAVQPPKEDPCKKCYQRGMDCVHGQCVPKKTIQPPKEDPCKKCYQQGMDCVLGRCVPKKAPEDPCKKCYQRGMDCVGGQCVPKKTMQPPKEDPCQKCYRQGMDCVHGRCVPKRTTPQQPKEDPCKKCYQRGMDCVQGQCVPKAGTPGTRHPMTYPRSPLGQ